MENKKDEHPGQGIGGGPKTEAGKAISSMNALKTGMFMTRFQRISEQAGKLKLCDSCNKEQKDLCISEKRCILHEELIVRYHLAHSERDPKHIEELNVIQLATMDLIFSSRLRYAIENLGKTKIINDKDGKKIGEREIIDQQYIYMLMNMMTNLSKTLPDMQLTRQTQENIDVEWAKLLETEIDPEKAIEAKRKILEGLNEFRKSSVTAKEMESQDEAIQDFLITEKKSKGNDEDHTNIDIGSIPGTPFGSDGNKDR